MKAARAKIQIMQLCITCFKVFFIVDKNRNYLACLCLPAFNHCVKSVQIRSFFWPVFSGIRTEYRKIRTRKNSIFGFFSHSESCFYFAFLFSSSFLFFPFPLYFLPNLFWLTAGSDKNYKLWVVGLKLNTCVV